MGKEGETVSHHIKLIYLLHVCFLSEILTQERTTDAINWCQLFQRELPMGVFSTASGQPQGYDSPNLWTLKSDLRSAMVLQISILIKYWDDCYLVQREHPRYLDRVGGTRYFLNITTTTIDFRSVPTYLPRTYFTYFSVSNTVKVMVKDHFIWLFWQK